MRSVISIISLLTISVVIRPSNAQDSVQQNSVTLAGLQQRFRERQDQDLKRYTPARLRQIEALFRVGLTFLNQPGERGAATESFRGVVKRYPDSNRAGCALVYLADLSDDPAQRETYLQTAIQEHSDSFYSDGVQVGAYARFMLGMLYQKQSKNDATRVLFDQIRKDYPDAVTHDGSLLSVLLPSE